MSSALFASLESHNSAFEALLSLIPARHYIRDETVDDEVSFILLLVFDLPSLFSRL